MKRETQPIKKEVNGGCLGGIKKSHPAFAMARFSRVSSTPGARLWGSEIESSHYIKFTLCEGTEDWSLSRKKFFGGSRIIAEFDMTASQFAEMITSMNMGSGVPVTLRYREEVGHVPDFMDPDTLQESIQEDLRADVKKVVTLTKTLRKELDDILSESNLSQKKKDKLTGIAEQIQMQLDSNMPFVLEQYREATEKVTASAKAEFESFMMHAITQLGVKSLREITATLPDSPPSKGTTL